MRHQAGEAFRRLSRPCLIANRNTQSVWNVNVRQLQVNATPSTESSIIQSENEFSGPGRPQGSSTPDARFEVLGSPYSLLSVSLSASQNLYTRRGTLVGVSGKPDNAVSTLSLLNPFRRAFLGIPFLYQRISSSTPLTALISTRSPITSFTVVHLDGRLDWMLAQRQALLAWTGHSLSIKPTVNTQMSLAHWGNSRVTGRGLLALTGKGQVYQVVLKAREEYIVHPANVLAYSITQNPPQPYRFKSSSLHLQIPSVNLGALIPDTKFFRNLSQTAAWRTTSNLFFTLRTWVRRSIQGDRLFLHFTGPSTILLQSRASRLRDVLTQRDVNELADAPAGAVQSAASVDTREKSGRDSSESKDTPPQAPSPTRMSYATVNRDGKVQFTNS